LKRKSKPCEVIHTKALPETVGLFLAVGCWLSLNFSGAIVQNFGLKSVSLRRFLEIQEYA
jgi:hypothetical protein